MAQCEDVWNFCLALFDATGRGYVYACVCVVDSALNFASSQQVNLRLSTPLIASALLLQTAFSLYVTARPLASARTREAKNLILLPWARLLANSNFP